jgi:shikimate dehydrogenase
MKNFGLIGFPLTHSFSKKYFTEKFEHLGLADTHQYDLYEMQNVDFLERFIAEKDHLIGLNVTIPHKLNVQRFLHHIDPAAQKIGAVNVIKVMPDKTLKGYNSDYYGFKKSLEAFLNHKKDIKALVLGTGGASRAVMVALADLGIPYQLVSRQNADTTLSYQEANELLASHCLVVNCTPLGTFPNTHTCPALDYSQLTPHHYLYDLVYNPAETLFLQKGKEAGAAIINGYEMLVLQAEKSWEIWNEEELETE